MTNSQIFTAILTSCLLALPNAGAAQSPAGDVTLQVPLNLTQLSTDIAKILIRCSITSSALRVTEPKTGQVGTTLSNRIEVPVTGGRLVTTAKIVFSPQTLVDPTGKSANYQCDLIGFSNSQQNWSPFSDSAPIAAFRLSPTPAPLAGSFVW
jgi:hypothetical protein